MKQEDHKFYHDESKFYVTTAIDYPNALPHIGTAFEKIGADVQARFQRFLGKEVYFLMGNDENTVKVARAVANHPEPSCTVQEYVDRMAVAFKDVWKALDISYDDFIQTSELRHRIGVTKFIETVYEAGYIDKRPYGGWYCEGCEEFKLEKNLKEVAGEKHCPNHAKVIWREEENYFFKLSEFKQWILDVLTPTPFLTAFTDVNPQSKLNEVNSFVQTELQDISISRRNDGWGIPIPWDQSQVIYVWFDALLNYLTGVGFGTDEEKFRKWWPAQVHVIGKDITRFHCALWLAMIHAYNKGVEKRGGATAKDYVAYPEEVFVHGFIYEKKGDEQVKVSKSSGGIKPQDILERYGADAYRYYFLAKCPFENDGEYSREHFNDVYNGELANNLGNLVSRTCQMIIQYNDGIVPYQDDSRNVVWFTKDDIQLFRYETEHFKYREALQRVWGVLTRANQYIEEQKPWSLAKTDRPECLKVLRNLAVCLRIVSVLLKAYLPKTAETIYDSFIWPDDVRWDEANWEFLTKLWADNYEGLEESFSLNPRALVGGEKPKYPVLFPRKDKWVVG